MITFPYEIINRYYKGQLFKNDIIKSIKLAFDNEIKKHKNENYKLIHNNKLLSFSSKIVAYDYFLFGHYNYIDNWMNNNNNYNINNVIEEPGYYLEFDNLYYIDLMSIFDKFFYKNSIFE